MKATANKNNEVIWYLSFTLLLVAIPLVSIAQNNGILQSNACKILGWAKDSNTVALWLFDESAYPNAPLLDASIYEIADLYLSSGSNVPGKFGNAISSGDGHNVIYACFAGDGALQPREEDGIPSGLFGPTFVSQKLNEAIGTKNYTFEFWLNLREIPSKDAFIFEMGRGLSINGFSIIMNSRASGITIMNYYSGISSHFDISAIRIKPNIFRHFLLAIDKNGSGYLYLDGKRISTASKTSLEKVALPPVESPRENFHENRNWPKLTITQRLENRFNLSLLEDRNAENELSAIIDEIRVSDIIRVDEDFNPVGYSKNYSNDRPIPGGITGPEQILSMDALMSYNASHPLNFGKRKHVFIDTKIFESGKITNLTLNQSRASISTAEKTNITSLDGEWRVSFLQDGDRQLAIATANYNSKRGLVYQYETTDGLNFTGKPANIVNYPMGGDAFLDLSPNANSDGTKFKMTAFVSNRAICLYTSPDGYTWKRNETGILPLLSGGSAESFYDDQNGNYVMYIKRDASFGNSESPKMGVRSSVRFFTVDPYQPWTFKKMNNPFFEANPYPVVTGEGEVQFVIPEGQTTDEQVYRTRVIKYPYAPDTYLGFPWILHTKTNDRDVAISVSRDGYNWDIIRNPYYFDKGNFIEAISCQGLLRKGDELWQYIECGGNHGAGPRYWYRVKQRLDGFFSLDAGLSEGSAVTKSLLISGESLYINYKAEGNGYVKIEIEDASETPIPGFEASNCQILNGDSTSQQVIWNSAHFSSLKNKTIRIKFILKNAKLYAFEIK